MATYDLEIWHLGLLRSFDIFLSDFVDKLALLKTHLEQFRI